MFSMFAAGALKPARQAWIGSSCDCKLWIVSTLFHHKRSIKMDPLYLSIPLTAVRATIQTLNVLEAGSCQRLKNVHEGRSQHVIFSDRFSFNNQQLDR